MLFNLFINEFNKLWQFLVLKMTEWLEITFIHNETKHLSKMITDWNKMLLVLIIESKAIVSIN